MLRPTVWFKWDQVNFSMATKTLMIYQAECAATCFTCMISNHKKKQKKKHKKKHKKKKKRHMSLTDARHSSVFLLAQSSIPDPGSPHETRSSCTYADIHWQRRRTSAAPPPSQPEPKPGRAQRASTGRSEASYPTEVITLPNFKAAACAAAEEVCAEVRIPEIRPPPKE